MNGSSWPRGQGGICNMNSWVLTDLRVEDKHSTTKNVVWSLTLAPFTLFIIMMLDVSITSNPLAAPLHRSIPSASIQQHSCVHTLCV